MELKANLTLLLIIIILSNLILLSYPLHKHYKNQSLTHNLRKCNHNIQKHIFTFNHQTAQQEYINKLSSQHQNIANTINQLQNSLSSTLSQVQSQSDIDQKITILQSSISRQRKIAQNLSNQLQINLNLETWSCPYISPQNKQDIKSSASKITQSLNKIQNIVNSYDPLNVPAKQSIQNQIQSSQNTLQSLQETIKTSQNDKQYDPNLAKKTYQTNIYAPGWFLGSKTLQDLTQQYQNKYNSYDQVITCPLDKPFYTGVSCLKCDGLNPHFSMTLQRCIKCNNLDDQKHICNDQNQPGQGSGSFNSGGSGSGDSGLNGSGSNGSGSNGSGSNGSGSNGSGFNGSGSNGSGSNGSGSNGSGSSGSGSNGSGSNGSGFSNNNKIKVSNLQAGKKKILIPQGKTYDDLKQEQNQLASKYGIQVCPQDKPYFKQNQCSNCQSNQIFSVSEQKCTVCPSGSNFNQNNYRCQNSQGNPVNPGDNQQYYYSKLDNQNWGSKNPVLLKTQIDSLKAKQNSLQCSTEKPFFNGQTCIQCNTGQHFDFDDNSCKNCDNGEVLNKNWHRCVSPDDQYHQTNPKTAPNLLFDGKSKNEWVSMYYQQQNSIEGIADCPTQTPYFDGTHCINCPQDHPLFNMVYALCQMCEKQTYYDKDIRQCLTISGNIADQTPTLEKMGAGIFT